jgi:hypothetical protein
MFLAPLVVTVPKRRSGTAPTENPGGDAGNARWDIAWRAASVTPSCFEEGAIVRADRGRARENNRRAEPARSYPSCAEHISLR